MSIYFIANEIDLWNPSNATGALYCEQANVIARYIQTESGLGPMSKDEVAVDPERFRAFAVAYSKFLLQLGAPPSGAHLLVDGCFALTAAMARKLGVELTDHPLIAELLSLGDRQVG